MTILCAIDDGEVSDEILTTANELAEAYDDELIVLHVMTQERFDTRAKSQEYYVDEGAADAADIAREHIAQTVTDTAHITPRGRVGTPAEEIIKLSEQLDPRYLVLGGRKRSPVGKALFGSVTQSIILEVDAPTVTIMQG